eukprot:m.176752 g.176752  ORF g.176752 m.176752 type:complete len:86 (+) comp25312_c0_seq12:43-300(+)
MIVWCVLFSTLVVALAEVPLELNTEYGKIKGRSNELIRLPSTLAQTGRPSGHRILRNSLCGASRGKASICHNTAPSPLERYSRLY